MKLLLDEHYSPAIARELRTRGHDIVAVAVTERPELIGLSDADLLERMVGERRVIVTNNVKDFMPLASRTSLESTDHFGLLLTFDKSMPRSNDAIGRYVKALEAFLQDQPAEDSCRNQVQWLTLRDHNRDDLAEHPLRRMTGM